MMHKIAFSFSNKLFRTFFAYLVTLAMGFLLFIGSERNITVIKVFLAFIFYSYIFLWIYFHNKILLEHLLFRKKHLWYFVAIIVGYFLWYAVAKLIADGGGFHVSHQIEVFSFILYTSLGVAIYLSVKYILEKNTFLRISLMSRETELQQLKTQLNPHFLFNALNNIYSYNLEKDRYGNELILKLGQLMHFIIDSGKSELISACDEFHFIENYIAFEKERLGDRCAIHYNKIVQNPQRKIPPLIFFPYIENAFKHGTGSIQKTDIHITIAEDLGSLIMSVRNSITHNGAPSTYTGLANARRRLDLLYPNKYDLHIDTDNKIFTVQLTLYNDEKAQLLNDEQKIGT